MQTMKTADQWLKDLPQQFQGKRRIEVLISAFARQMDEIRQVFDDLNRFTDIDNAHGVNLDRVGDIVVLSRKDAQVILRSRTDLELEDEVYRQVLRYKAVRNTCDCTYEDIVGTLKLLWDVEYITYVEKPERPATIFMEMPPFDINIADPVAKRVLSIRPAGVGLIYALFYHVVADNSQLEKMLLQAVLLHYSIPFWGCRIFDGTWIFDGSVLMDAKRRYDLRMCLKYYMGTVYSLSGSYGLLFDGTWNPDGSGRFDAEYSGGYVDIRRNLWYFDGTECLDGSKKLNAMYRREML